MKQSESAEKIIAQKRNKMSRQKNHLTMILFDSCNTVAGTVYSQLSKQVIVGDERNVKSKTSYWPKP